MSRRARRRRDAPFSLFSFQDIMASVTGMVILVTLLLILELADRVPVAAAQPPATQDPAPALAELQALREHLLARAQTAPESLHAARDALHALERLHAVLESQATQARDDAARHAEQTAQLRDQLDALRDETQSLLQRAQLRRAQTRVTLVNPRPGHKHTWFIDCATPDALAVGRIDPDGVTHPERRFTSPDLALAWALAQPPDAHRFVLLVRPQGVPAFNQLQQTLRAAGYDLGWDLWPNDTPLFPNPQENPAPHAPR